MVTNIGLTTVKVFQELEKRVGTVTMFSYFRQEFMERVGTMPSNAAGWEHRRLGEREAAEFMQSVIAILEDMATRFAHTTDDPVYGEATTIAQALHTILANEYGFQSCDIQIMSPTRRMEKAGLVTVETNEDGELIVKPKV